MNKGNKGNNEITCKDMEKFFDETNFAPYCDNTEYRVVELWQNERWVVARTQYTVEGTDHDEISGFMFSEVYLCPVDNTFLPAGSGKESLLMGIDVARNIVSVWDNPTPATDMEKCEKMDRLESVFLRETSEKGDRSFSAFVHGIEQRIRQAALYACAVAQGSCSVSRQEPENTELF